MKALGVHVFAGGFTMGVRKVVPVVGQLEIHDFGRETVEQRLGLEFINRATWDQWPAMQADMVYGNPRCTGFSTTTSGYPETIHGPFAKCTQDIRDLVAYGLRHRIPVICWESVQQAWSTGKPLVDLLVRECAKEGYRVAHLFINAATFDNAQQRKRYFFLAYRAGKNFNIEAPVLRDRHTTVRDVLEPLWDLPTRSYNHNNSRGDYEPDDWRPPNAEEAATIPHLLWSECFNQFATRGGFDDGTVSLHYKRMWDERMSDIPFSLHAPRRLHPDRCMPTISSSASNFVHPEHDRFLTVREVAALMGWPLDVTPAGPKPVFQIAKGICPEVGAWLARQALLYHEDAWGKEDFDSTWNRKLQRWEGHDYSSDVIPPVEKIFDLTTFHPRKPCDLDDEDSTVLEGTTA